MKFTFSIISRLQNNTNTNNNCNTNNNNNHNISSSNNNNGLSFNSSLLDHVSLEASVNNLDDYDDDVDFNNSSNGALHPMFSSRTYVKVRDFFCFLYIYISA